eukprot:TRINITY_DN4135_c3_g1_i2.p1 TRINITY_DN4135_c3_g1~~TRINITY_DN4135_c3_g1_i2.p1  ORF type:complete len:105 (+),score=4.80 TRINITY_DN4135_c3_g1_i2:299-613(+)
MISMVFQREGNQEPTDGKTVTDISYVVDFFFFFFFFSDKVLCVFCVPWLIQSGFSPFASTVFLFIISDIIKGNRLDVMRKGKYGRTIFFTPFELLVPLSTFYRL